MKKILFIFFLLTSTAYVSKTLAQEVPQTGFAKKRNEEKSKKKQKFNKKMQRMVGADFFVDQIKEHKFNRSLNGELSPSPVNVRHWVNYSNRSNPVLISPNSFTYKIVPILFPRTIL